MSTHATPLGPDFLHPLFAGFARWRGLPQRWTVAELNRLEPTDAGPGPFFVAQTPDLLADGLHYEQRIAERGLIATREGGVHDLFNALTWLAHPALKRAMNARQAADVARVGPKQRTRGQCALTHFDEAGAIVWLADADLLAAWDAHDWAALFLDGRRAWGARVAVTVVGHALHEYALEHCAMPVAKALAVAVDGASIAARSGFGAAIASWPELERRIASEIADGRLLADPQELRPLPLAGVPRWHAGEQTAEFYASAPCFRPLREGRRYPPPFAPVQRCEDLPNVKTANEAAACRRDAPSVPRAGNFF